MSKVYLGIEPILYVKDGSKITFYWNLNDIDIETVAEVTFVFSQDDKTCTYYKYPSAPESGVITGYDSKTNRVYMTLNFGNEENDTTSFELGKPIKFEIAAEIVKRVKDDLDSMLVDKQTIIEAQPSIVITESASTGSLFEKL